MLSKIREWWQQGAPLRPMTHRIDRLLYGAQKFTEGFELAQANELQWLQSLHPPAPSSPPTQRPDTTADAAAQLQSFVGGWKPLDLSLRSRNPQPPTPLTVRKPSAQGTRSPASKRPARPAAKPADRIGGLAYEAFLATLPTRPDWKVRNPPAQSRNPTKPQHDLDAARRGGRLAGASRPAASQKKGLRGAKRK